MAKKTLSFVPQILDLVLYAGDGSGIRFTITNTVGEPVPLTGEIKAQIRSVREAVDPPLVDFGVNLDDWEDGIVLIFVTKEQTHSLISSEEKFTGVWDMEWIPTDAEPLTLVQGKVECLDDVTH